MKFMHLFILTISLSATPIYAKEGPADIIQQTLEEMNQTQFASYAIHVELLKNCPETIPTLAEWEYQDWHGYNSSLTREALIEGFSQRLNDDRLPLTFVAFRGATPVGIISLEDRAEPELADLEDGSPWGGSFHIIPIERNQGLGEAMARLTVSLADRLGYAKIRFFTSNAQVVHWYTERGADILGKRQYQDHEVTVMQYCFSKKI